MSDYAEARTAQVIDFPESETDDQQEFANGGTPGEQAFVAPEEVELPETEEAVLRRQAIMHHRGRALRQVFASIGIVIVAASALPLWTFVGGMRNGDFGDAIVNLPIIGGRSVEAVQWFVTGFILFQFVRLVWYRRERLNDWETYKAEASANDPTTSADGYMRIFRLYAKTKRRAMYAILTGVVSLWWVIAAFYALGAARIEDAGLPITTVLLVTQAVASLGMLAFGYAVGRSFLPGRTLVHNTLIINFRAATSQTHYDRAREEAIRVENTIKRRQPWWFFRYSAPRD